MELHPASTEVLADSPAPATGSAPTSLAASAQAEFRASVRLLAERAAFLTAASGVAIALPEEPGLTYCAAIGSVASQAGNVVESSRASIKECLQSARAIREAVNGEFKLLAPILTDEKAVGFFELISKYEWLEPDIEAVVRLADLAAVIVEHRLAAATAEARAWQGLHEQLSPVAWHAPEKSEPATAERVKKDSAEAASVRMCAACGFPVSPGRNLCVECEQKSENPVSAPAELFSAQNQESWISEHGYTVASLIVSALAAAIIFWWRR